MPRRRTGLNTITERQESGGDRVSLAEIRDMSAADLVDGLLEMKAIADTSGHDTATFDRQKRLLRIAADAITDAGRQDDVRDERKRQRAAELQNT